MTSELAAGVGLRSRHFVEQPDALNGAGFVEIHAENYLAGGPALRRVEALRRDLPLSVHAVALSPGAAGGLDENHVRRVAVLIDRLQPRFVSDHLAWTGVDGVYLNDLMPLPYTEESLGIVSANVARLQDIFRRRVMIENPSSYLRFAHSTIAESAFLAELARRTGCGLLCDLNNIHVTCHNVGLDAQTYLAALPADAIGEFHLACHAVNDADGETVLIDDHGSRVAEPVWALYRDAVRRFGPRPTMIEWDTDVPALEVLLAEARRADVEAAAALASPPLP